jgi:nitrate reductase gamma subunit
LRLWGDTVTNELYLYISYFAAATGGVLFAAATAALWLRRSHREATGVRASGRLGKVLRRAFPAWLVLAVLLGFTSVTYFDCGHGGYAAVVADRGHLVHKTQEQVTAMARYLAVALIAYGFVLTAVLAARARRS